MKIALFRTLMAVGIVFTSGLTALVDAKEPAGTGQAPLEQPANAPRDVRAAVASAEGRRPQSATVERQQVSLADGGTVTVLRPLAPVGEEASGQEEDVQRQMPLAWQVAAGQRLWLIDPATGDLRTCAVRQTSTVGVEAIRCLRLRQAFGRTFAP